MQTCGETHWALVEQVPLLPPPPPPPPLPPPPPPPDPPPPFLQCFLWPWRLATRVLPLPHFFLWCLCLASAWSQVEAVGSSRVRSTTSPLPRRRSSIVRRDTAPSAIAMANASKRNPFIRE